MRRVGTRHIASEKNGIPGLRRRPSERASSPVAHRLPLAARPPLPIARSHSPSESVSHRGLSSVDMASEIASWRSITVLDASVPFLHRGFQRPGDSDIVWRAADMHHELSRAGYGIPVNKFMSSWKRRLQGTPGMDVERAVLFRPKGTPIAEGQVSQHLLSTAAIIRVVARSCGAQQVRPPVRELCRVWLRELARWCCEAVRADDQPVDLDLLEEGFALRLHPSGTMTGFDQVAARLNPALQASWKETVDALPSGIASLLVLLDFAIKGALGPLATKAPRRLMESVLEGGADDARCFPWLRRRLETFLKEAERERERAGSSEPLET